MLPLVYGLFGLIIGSFLNVVVLRRSILSVGGRSACMSCETELKWYELIPVFSWLVLRGKCRTCGSAISVQYPLVEATTAVLFSIVGATPFALDPVAALIALFIVATLVAIAAYDIRHTIIPDRWGYSFAAASLLFMFYMGIPFGASWLMYLAAGPIAALPISTLWFVSGGRWIGLGDAKLSLGIGWLLGPVYGISAVFFAFVIGAIISVCILIPLPHVMRMLDKKGIVRFRSHSAALTMKSEVPFGPFLIAGCLIVWFAILFNLPLPF
jgi:leader peptidase (prepilin peptidase)/N-methyltransferase